MIDHCGREIDYMRISLTDRCNLRCVYCMPEDGTLQTSHFEILRFDEIVEICSAAAEIGIRKIKLTGGEPLVRKGCAALVKNLKEIPGIEQVTLTTNGILLAQQMKELADAGIDGINISLDTLDDTEFASITRRNEFSEVMIGLKAALQYPRIPLKINCVPISDNEETFIRLAGIAEQYPVHVRFIEIMPIGLGRQFTFRSEESLIRLLEKEYGPLTPVSEHLGNGPCRYYRAEGFKGRIGFISAISHKFCDQCNRVRLTSEGYLKQCLQYDIGTDLKSILRENGSKEQLIEAMKTAIFNKPVSHHFHETPDSRETADEQKGMSQIGG